MMVTKVAFVEMKWKRISWMLSFFYSLGHMIESSSSTKTGQAGGMKSLKQMLRNSFISLFLSFFLFDKYRKVSFDWRWFICSFTRLLARPDPALVISNQHLANRNASPTPPTSFSSLANIRSFVRSGGIKQAFKGFPLLEAPCLKHGLIDTKNTSRMSKREER